MGSCGRSYECCPADYRSDCNRIFHFGSDYLKPDCSIEAFGERIHKTLKRYPYLVSEKDGRLAGYAYAGPFKERRAYDWSVETTIYIAKDVRGHGLGKELYTALEHALALQNVINLNACIAYPDPEDEYLTRSDDEI
ncbi:MAG: GNAT family N-acetyltransferase [Lachnospiraceae bacterium]|nr:GNAT family N-acetyltransferase [Lachnospiraceae bacterium]